MVPTAGREIANRVAASVRLGEALLLIPSAPADLRMYGTLTCAACARVHLVTPLAVLPGRYSHAQALIVAGEYVKSHIGGGLRTMLRSNHPVLPTAAGGSK
jgi:hypothetical protein